MWLKHCLVNFGLKSYAVKMLDLQSIIEKEAYYDSIACQLHCFSIVLLGGAELVFSF